MTRTDLDLKLNTITTLSLYYSVYMFLALIKVSTVFQLLFLFDQALLKSLRHSLWATILGHDN